MKDLTDYTLCQSLNNGSEKAFSEIYNRYWSSIYLLAEKRISDRFIAEEIVQTIFLNLWKRRCSVQIKETFASYFGKAVKFEVINYFARCKHKESYLKWLEANRLNATFSLEEEIQAKFLNEAIEKSVCLLPDKCQLIFRLRVEKGLSQKEIANELSIAEKTVENQLLKARRHIRNSIGASASLKAFLLFLIS